MRVCTDAAFTFRREFQKFFNELALLIEQLFRAITLEPLFKNFQVPTLGIHVCNRHLMGSPGTFDRLAIHDLWSSPTLRSPQDDHGPDWKRYGFLAAPFILDGADLFDHCVERCRHELMHPLGFVSFYEIGFVSVAMEELS